jgi:hypothetical protein
MFKKITGVLLTIALVMTLVPGAAFAHEGEAEQPREAAEAQPAETAAAHTDYARHWAAETIDRWLGEKLLLGYPDGGIHPDANISRAEFVTLVSRIFGFSQTAAFAFQDVSANAWHSGAIGAGVAAGYISDGHAFRPNEAITRREAGEILAPVLKLDGVNGFDAAVKAGVFIGDDDGALRADDTITRAETLTVFDRASGERHLAKGGYGGTDAANPLQTHGNVTLGADGANLKNAEIHGTLILSAGIGDGDITLENLNVSGDTIIYGGGSHTVTATNSQFGRVIIDKGFGEAVHFDAKGTTKIARIDALSANSTIEIEENASIAKLNANAPTTITGEGKIDLLVVASEDVISAINPAALSLSDGIMVSIGGKAVSGSFGAVADAAPAAGGGGSTASGSAQKLTTNYSDLWTSNSITVTVGVPVAWYVYVPPGSFSSPTTRMDMGGMDDCAKTIKIPGLGWGTDTHNKNEGHLTLEEGSNFVYEFTPTKTGDILFTCWMGSGCHKNYIHVVAAGGNPSSPTTPEPTPAPTTPTDNEPEAPKQQLLTLTGWFKDRHCTSSLTAGAILTGSCSVACGTGGPAGAMMAAGCQNYGHGIWINPDGKNPGYYLTFDKESSELLRAFLFRLNDVASGANGKLSLTVTGHITGNADASSIPSITDEAKTRSDKLFHAVSITGDTKAANSYQYGGAVKNAVFTQADLIPQAVRAKAGTEEGTATVSFTPPVSAASKSVKFGVKSYTVYVYDGENKAVKSVTVANDPAGSLTSITVDDLGDGSYTFTVTANYTATDGYYSSGWNSPQSAASDAVDIDCC